jgi:hypothetical protein
MTGRSSGLAESRTGGLALILPKALQADAVRDNRHGRQGRDSARLLPVFAPG